MREKGTGVFFGVTSLRQVVRVYRDDNHWHMVLRPSEDGLMGRMLRCVTATHPQRYHAHDHVAVARESGRNDRKDPRPFSLQEEVNRVSFAPDSQRIVSSSKDSTARVWHVESGPQMWLLEGIFHEVYDVSFGPNGKTIAVGSPMTVTLLDFQTGDTIGSLRPHPVHRHVRPRPLSQSVV